jgi:uncharacterized membrane protein
MVVNHTARWWLEPAAGPPREALVYVTMVLAGPTFLLLVGVSLALAHHAALAQGRPFRAVAARQLRRAAGILGAGFLVNALVFPGDVLGARVLISIALAIVLATPLLPLLRSRPGRWALLALAAALYGAFLATLPDLARWSRAHPVAAGLLLREFPVFPWLGLVLAGLVLGAAEARGRDAGRRRHAALAAGGLLGVAAYVALGAGTPLPRRLALGRDLSLNDYWTAAPVTAVGMVGAILLLVAGAHALVEGRGWRLPALVALGRAALPIYVVHLVIVAPVAREAWGVSLRDWESYALATAVLLTALVGLAAAWLAIRARARPPAGPGPAAPGDSAVASDTPAAAARPQAAIASQSPS